jgi:hypothetical protein
VLQPVVGAGQRRLFQAPEELAIQKLVTHSVLNFSP